MFPLPQQNLSKFQKCGWCLDIKFAVWIHDSGPQKEYSRLMELLSITRSNTSPDFIKKSEGTNRVRVMISFTQLLFPAVQSNSQDCTL
jgi:hypothetical protein